MDKVKRPTSKKERKVPSYYTGTVATMLYSNLLRDFRKSEGANFGAQYDHELLSDVKSFRTLPEYVDDNDTSVRGFKRRKQMNALLKKFRFEKDAYTDDELSERSLNKFLEEQLRLHRPMPLKLSGYKVLQRARLIAKSILGEYPGDEVIENTRFGKKSSIGCPLSEAYIDIKLSKSAAVTGTDATTKHFLDQVLPGDHVLKRILKRVVPDWGAIKEQLSIAYLNLVEVPKTWKIFRLITPLTLIGLFFSYGFGRVVQTRLDEYGLKISRLQEIHRRKVRLMSLYLDLATADLSAASDSITSELLNRVLPRPWYVALKKTFVRHLRVEDGSEYSTVSVLPMGNGATFPVETLVFYCIIKAIGELTGFSERRVGEKFSVYGDDLIYPTKMHKYVVGIFPQLHLKLNLDKTFTDFPFRESCGADYYRGQDVRPYFLKGEACYLSSIRYQAFLYKVYNGLIARWDPLEIRETLTWLLTELAHVSGKIYLIPPSFPDYSGVKVTQWTDIPLSYNLLPFSRPVVHLNHGSRWFQFDFLTETPKKRIVKTVEPYYWLALQGINDEVVDHHGRSLADPYGKYHERDTGFRIRTPIIDKHGRYESHELSGTYAEGEKRSSLKWSCTYPKTGKFYYHHGRKVEKRRIEHKHEVDSRKGSTVSSCSARTESVSDWF
jgi:hypothetical protein